jgi:hypothetical protein
MPLNYFTGSAASVNWSATSSWTLGRIPTSVDGDTAYFGPTSPTCSFDVSNGTCYNFDISTYNRTFTLLQSLFIYGTYSNFGSGVMKFNASSGLPGSLITFMGTCSITSNGYVFKREGNNNPGTLRFGYNSVSTTITLLDQFEATNITVSPQTGTPTTTFNGATLSVRESFTTTTNGVVSGTSNIQLRATASSTTTTMNTATNPISNSIYVNSPGIVNITTLIMLSNNNTFRYISGSLSITSFSIQPNNSTFTYDNSANTLINTTTFAVNSNNPMTFSCVYPLNTTTLTMNGGGGSTTTNYFIYGGFSCSTFTSTNGNSNTNLIISLNPTSSYFINGSFNCNSFLSLTRTEFKSTASTASLIINYNATQTIFDTYFTNIDASGGATILPYLKFATLSSTSNILDLKSWYIMNNQIQIN